MKSTVPFPLISPSQAKVHCVSVQFVPKPANDPPSSKQVAIVEETQLLLRQQDPFSLGQDWSEQEVLE